ncbi:LexA family protein, partial [Staphylococcus hominis]|uniref:LexA family protein n=1 Tax=Staphylococcus hominis TaxID=1290 RepID=UPI003709AB91
AEALSLPSSSTLHAHLSTLQQKPYITTHPTKPTPIQILTHQNNHITTQQTIYLPLIPKVTPGVPITPVQNIEQYFPLPQHLTST